MFKRLLLLVLCLPAAAMACSFPNVSFTANFETGRLGDCQALATDSYLLTVVPEQKRLNPSPWFHFKVTPKKPELLHIKMAFSGFKPRYLPKISHDHKHWQEIAFTTEGNTMSFDLKLGSKPLWVAGQPPFYNEQYTTWLKDKAKQSPDAHFSLLGKSAEGRPLYQVIRQKPGNHEWVVIVGRQHPPEVTGADALLAFVDTLFTRSAESKAFFNRFNLILIPDLNPDGVAHGNWRDTSQKQDLNRDWGNFSQAESRLVRDKLASLTKHGDRIVYGLDFHSTRYDIFYTMPKSDELHPADLTATWLTALGKRTDWIEKPSIKPGTHPNSGVFKQFIADTYHVHGVTYEVGDNTPLALIRYLGAQAADSFMKTLLATPPTAFTAAK
ncbi:M14 family metallopeptidase [Gallaecimonas mangrovi]|uniref:M14 family metallopeptidase n=1 Tax=Gallaecimonas mangrovi TaxID=2291597 RepID=UPI000E2092FE|nr:M14 family metallopeptidase [Gallaecimonas mangrovi]